MFKSISSPISKANVSFSFKVSAYFVYIMLLICQSPCEGRSYPRLESKSFRFPSESDSEISSGFDSIAEPTMKNSAEFSTYIHPRKAAIPSSPIFPNFSNGMMKVESSESESEEDDSSSVAILVPASSSQEVKPNYSHADEEELRKLLCLPVTSSVNKENAKTFLIDGNTTTPTLAKTVDDGMFNSSPEFETQVRYDLQYGKCGVVGRREHCGENMIFVAEVDSGAYGYCECDFENKIRRRSKRKEDQRSSSTLEYILTPLVYHPDTKACYPLYEQAYCKEGFWLVLSRDVKGPICKQRKCPYSTNLPSSPPTLKSATKRSQTTAKNEGSASRRRSSKLLTPELWKDEAVTRHIHIPENNEPSFWVPFNGDGPCVLLNRGNDEFCEKGESILFNTGSIRPKCGIPGRAIEGRAIVKNACPPGSFYSIIGRCQPDWDF